MRRRFFLVFILVSALAVMGCKISGTVTQDGVGLEGITVTLSGDASMSTTTDAGGTYVFYKLKPGNYTVTPEDDDYDFDPESIPVEIGRKWIVRADFKVDESKLPTPQPPSWSTYQGNAAHTGYVPVELDPIDFSFGWERKLTDSVPINPVAAGDGKVFVTTGEDSGPQVAVALDSADGTTLWTYDFGVISSVHPPAYANGSVYIQSGVGVTDSFLRAFDAEPDSEGLAVVLSEIPYVNRTGRFYAPTIYDDDVNVGVYTGGGYITEDSADLGRAYGFGFDGFDLEELWHVDFSSFQSDQWTPAVNEDHVIAYHGVFKGQLTVIHRLDGETWAAGDVDFIIPDPDFMFDGTSMDSAPVLGSQNNVIVIQGGRLVNFDLEKQAIGWEIQEEEGDEEGFSGQPSLAPPTSLAEGIIFAVYEGKLRALNESDGSFITGWRPWRPDGEIIDGPMIVTDNLIFVSTTSIDSTASKTYAVYLADQTGEQIFLSPDQPAPGGHLAISDEGVLFIATNDGRLIAINTF